MLFCLCKSRAAGLVLLRGPIGNLLLDGCFTVAGVGVIAEELRSRPAALLLQLFEEVGQGLRVVTRLPENDGADRIRLGFVAARVLQHQALRAKSKSLLRQLAADSAQGSARDGLGNAREN